MYYAPGSFGTACGLADGRQGGPQLVCWPEVAQCPVGQLPDQALAVGHHALGVVLVQLGHDHVQTVDKHLRRDLKEEEDGRIIFTHDHHLDEQLTASSFFFCLLTSST